MHSCNLVKYSLSEPSDFKDSLWELIFKANHFFFKVHLIKVRSLSYCRIIDCEKHFELTHCFSSQNLLIFCYKWQVLVVPLQTERLEENWENTERFTQDSLSSCGARLAPQLAWLAVLPFNVLERIVAAKGLLLGFFWMETRSLPCQTQCYRFWVQNTNAHFPVGYNTCKFSLWELLPSLAHQLGRLTW